MRLSAAAANAINNGDLSPVVDFLASLSRQFSSALAAVAPTGSPFTYTNATTYIQNVVISGGTVSSIALTPGGVTGETAGTWLLRPGDGVTVTYSAAPTVFNAVNLF